MSVQASTSGCPLAGPREGGAGLQGLDEKPLAPIPRNARQWQAQSEPSSRWQLGSVPPALPAALLKSGPSAKPPFWSLAAQGTSLRWGEGKPEAHPLVAGDTLGGLCLNYSQGEAGQGVCLKFIRKY